MYLSKLELHGFKSFAERTVLHFDPGITAIVGPNGCGKSNIVDAVRWVIGEQRARILRSEKMENVIFNGTSRRRPLGMSEVLLTIQNTRSVLPTEYGEVTLGRRLYRSGDSEYLLNDVQCRLKDITDLFMDTGMGAGAYSVIELKMVDEILSDNAQDRRRLFEEAAGITRYKLRRKQTLSKLEGTQVDLDRVRDLTEEVGKQVRSLKRQAEKAARYKEYATRLRRLELTLAQIEFDRLSHRERELSHAMEDLTKEIERLSADERSLDTRLTDGRTGLATAEAALETARRELASHVESVRSLETDQRLTLERLDGAHRDLERMRVEEERDVERLEALGAETSETRRTLASAEPDYNQAEQRRAQLRDEREAARTALARQKDVLEGLRKAERSIETRRADDQRRIDREISRREFLESEQARLRHEREAIAESLTRAAKTASDSAQTFEERQAEARAARLEMQQLQEQRAEAERILALADDHVRQLEKRREGLAAEVQLLERLVASFEEFPDAVQFLAADASWHSEPIVTVADVLSTPAAYRAALDTALGPLASCIVVPDFSGVARAAALLTRQEKGRATFIVLDRLEPTAGRSSETPALLAKVSLSEGRYEALAHAVLGDVLLANSLDEARDLAQEYPGARVVTSSGEWTVGGHLVHTGSPAATPSALEGRMERRDQLAAGRTELDNVDRQIGEARNNRDEAHRTVEAVEPESRREALQQAERALAEAEKDEARASFELDTMRRRLLENEEREASLTEEIEQISHLLVEQQDAVADLERELGRLVQRRAEAEQSHEDAEAQARRTEGHFNDANVAAIQTRNRFENLQRELTRIESAVEAIDARRRERSAHRTSLTDQVSAWQRELDDLRERTDVVSTQQEPLQDAVEAATAAVADSRSAIAAIETDLKEIRKKREETIRSENQHAVHRAEVGTRLQDLEQSIAEDFEIALGKDRVDVEAIDEQSAREEVHDLRQKVRGLGAVNELALESYEEERERLEFLESQQRDLQSAEQTLLQTIHEINTTASTRFAETYDAIQESFRRIFRQLFGEDASAELILEDPRDPLESPIEISARPRGKRPSTIAQLSGGEKTLTAIALLFAIYLVKPSPFCILDEVDAPLDDANVERFMSLIRTFSSDTQFILVTHNKRTMEAADRLYGITMQEQGVSRLVGVTFDDAAEMVG